MLLALKTASVTTPSWQPLTRALACGTTIELCVATFPDYQQVTVVTVHIIPADVLSHRAHTPFIPRQRLDGTVCFGPKADNLMASARSRARHRDPGR
jgi:hypothetical protein